MENAIEVTMGNTTYNVGAIIFAATLLSLAMALVVSGVFTYRRNMGRSVVAVAVASGAGILATIVLGMMEIIPVQASGPLLIMEFGLIATIFWVWMLAECATKESSLGNDKIVWVMIILFTHVLGAALYYFLRRPERKAEAVG